MSQVTVQEVLSSEDWQSTTEPGKWFTSYQVRFDGEQQKGEAQITKIRGSGGPTVGESFDGEVVQKGGRMVLKKVKAAPSFERDVPWSGNKGSTWKPEDPKKSAEIRRMACQRAAIELLTAEVHAGLKFENEPAGKLLVLRIEWLEKDVIDAGLRAELPQ